jgi:hypothetical protein
MVVSCILIYVRELKAAMFKAWLQAKALTNDTGGSFEIKSSISISLYVLSQGFTRNYYQA